MASIVAMFGAMTVSAQYFDIDEWYNKNQDQINAFEEMRFGRKKVKEVARADKPKFKKHRYQKNNDFRVSFPTKFIFDLKNSVEKLAEKAPEKADNFWSSFNTAMNSWANTASQLADQATDNLERLGS